MDAVEKEDEVSAVPKSRLGHIVLQDLDRIFLDFRVGVTPDFDVQELRHCQTQLHHLLQVVLDELVPLRKLARNVFVDLI